VTILLSRLAAVVLASLTALVIFVPLVTGDARSVMATTCGGTTNPVQQEFDIAQAKDIWKVFPAMMEAPELASDSRPAHVVVYAGNFDLKGLIAAPGKIPVVSDAVCVVQADGTPNLYENVSKAGAKLP
jgi:hypothetical protein